MVTVGNLGLYLTMYQKLFEAYDLGHFGNGPFSKLMFRCDSQTRSKFQLKKKFNIGICMCAVCREWKYLIQLTSVTFPSLLNGFESKCGYF